MKRRIALFDFDGTLIKGDSIARLVRHMFFRGLMTGGEMLRSIWNTILWKTGRMPVEAVKTHALSPLNRLKTEEAETFLREFVKVQVAPFIYEEGLAAMKKHKEEGDLVLLVSASPLCYLQYMKDELPCDAILATKTDEHHQVIINVVRDEKNRQINAWLKENQVEADFEASFAYGDSRNDLPMLSMVGHPFLCNPHMKARLKAPDIPVLTWR